MSLHGFTGGRRGMGAAKTAVIYARISPRRNAEESESIEAQLEECRAFCKRNGYAIAAEHVDRALSGAEEDRPGLWAAVEAVPRGGVLLVSRPDRLARDVFLSEYVRRMLGRKRAAIEAVRGGTNGRESPEQTMMRQVLEAFAEYERKMIAARTKAAMMRHQAGGRRMCGRHRPPYGWRLDPADDSRLVPDESEQMVIEFIEELRGQGFTYHRIARTLEEAGIDCRGRPRWNHETVKRILARRPYERQSR